MKTPGTTIVESPEEKLTRLERENAELKTERELRDAKDAEAKALELLIAPKVAKGLTRLQALAVLKRQTFYDELQKRQWEERRPSLLRLLQKLRCESEEDLRMNRDARLKIRMAFPECEIVLPEMVAALEWKKAQSQTP